MLKFVINQSKKISIRNLISEPLSENWTYQWFACRTNKGCDGTDIFYSVIDNNGNSVLNDWISDSSVNYEFFELSSSNDSFFIFVKVNKNDGSDICIYELEIKVVDELEPEIKVIFSELDCIDITAELQNELIFGKVFAKNSPKLQQIQLSVPQNNNIEFANENPLFVSVNLVEVSEIDDVTEYKFSFKINILKHGKGSIIANFIPKNITITHNFFILPNFLDIFNNNLQNNRIETTLPWACSSNTIGQNSTIAPEIFTNNETITTILDLKIFDNFLSDFEFIYSVAKVYHPYFCYSDDINIVSDTDFEEVLRIDGSQTDGVSHKFIANLSSEELNNLARPFAVVIRLEVRKIADNYCSNLGNDTANLRGWTILETPIICDNIIPHKNPEPSNVPHFKICDCCEDCGDDPICLEKCAENSENYKYEVEASVPCESICFRDCECWDALGIDEDVSTEKHYYRVHITNGCNEPYHKDCPECWRLCPDCPSNCGGHNDCDGECYRGEYKNCVENCDSDEE